MKGVPELCVAGRPCEIGISKTQREEEKNAAAWSLDFIAGFGVPLALLGSRSCWCSALCLCCDVPGAGPTALFRRSAGMCLCLPPTAPLFTAFPAPALQLALKSGASFGLSALQGRASEKLGGSRRCMGLLGFMC